MSDTTRRATKAGTWYTQDAAQLLSELKNWLAQGVASNSDLGVDFPSSRVKAVIVPHAGYRFSGATAGHAYHAIDVREINRVFLIGPNHHWAELGDRVGVTHLKSCETPMGPIFVDTIVTQALQDEGLAIPLRKAVDEQEHSLEMQMPYLFHIMADAGKTPSQWTLVPLMVGHTSAAQEKKLAAFLSPHLADPHTLFVISSDFCHWGEPYGYMPRESAVPIYKSIETMDRRGMTLIEQQNVAGFRAYLDETRNTICGRHAISLLLETLDHLHAQPDHVRLQGRFVHYTNSGRVERPSDFSVSYASAVFVTP
ncbi:hypothetical protein CXG81DRAFT_17761 [Caulochytrium protostelioides]|uniref:Uncharacterized protein n=1 Tax=Caulochytrium protostelioides TaxID=1555241 RepID=A0A4V1ITS0_9FUNG|nr:hypothetical protein CAUPRSCDRAFT_5570 [Caulochytrium protostelioides]RKP02623.1 hypothetical protein CXG81DRAFT_17761 [Caulochytrium protostelioides]|eukprot:RKP02623.1 hypothetical protein CXG81DRAFT_17761 [Caulochytrium protostelioides]